jgi:hypothetical protein
MIADGAWRAEVAARLRAADLDATIYAREEADHFAAAIEYLLEHHERLQVEADRQPIHIGRG